MKDLFFPSVAKAASTTDGAAKIRSKTFERIAAAMAQQWGGVGV